MSANESNTSAGQPENMTRTQKANSIRRAKAWANAKLVHRDYHAAMGGFTQAEIAERHGVCRETVCAWLAWVDGRTCGPSPLRNGRKTVITEAMLDRMRKLRSDGIGYRAIARELGIVHSTVINHLRGVTS